MAIWDPEIDLELDEGEEILYQCHHHWLMLVVDEIVPFFVVVLFGGIAIYRALGGGLFALDITQAQRLDWASFILIGLLGVLAVVWARGLELTSKRVTKNLQRAATWALQIAMLCVAAIFWYRFQGGRVFVLNPGEAAPFDLLNLVLIGIAIAGVVWMLYTALDWRDDALVLTNTRIILDKDQFLVRHIQEQILLIDLQQVNLRQNTYPQVLFGYGTITVQSFSLKKIMLDYAANPKEMERRIKEESTKISKKVEPNIVRRMVAERVFDEKKAANGAIGHDKKFHVTTKGANRTGIFAWLFPANPQIDEKSGQITWRPSSVYVAIQILKPVTIWLVTTLVVAFLIPSLAELMWVAVLVWVVVTLVCAGWIFWQREELVNDVYILNKREIIDVDQKPFGPIDRRSAPIDRIQNISFDVTFIEQLLGFGTVKVQTGGSGDFSFNHVPDPRGVQAMINDYLTDFKKGAQERNLQNSIDVFREYHALQNEKGELMDRSAIDQAIDAKTQLAVDTYADQIAPIQMALTVRQALRSQIRTERRERVRKLIARRRILGDDRQKP
jgi:Bacterial PH domain